MASFSLITAFGPDRSGIVASIAEALYRLGCNLEDTCMTRLRGEFTMMIMVRLPDGMTADHLAGRLSPTAATLGLTLVCRPLPERAAAREPEPDLPVFMLSVYGADHPGIVAKVARVVADHGGNVTDMNTRVVGAADRPVYVMILEVQLPAGSSPDAVSAALEALKPALGVDLTFRPLEQVRL